jgi:hypothetical protein
MGARNGGLAYASACSDDQWGLFNNVAGIANAKSLSAAFAYEAVPSFRSFDRMAATVVIPSKFVVAGAGFFRFGDDLYNEQILTVGFANTFGIASLGIKGNYVQYSIEGFGSRGFATVSVGGIARFTKHLSIGAHILNINPPKLSRHSDESLPTKLTIGIAVKPSDKLLMTTELEKDLSFALKWKTGIEYAVNKKFWARTGYIFQPQHIFFGVGFKAKKIQIDYCLQITNVVGTGHQVSVAYQIKTRDK